MHADHDGNTFKVFQAFTYYASEDKLTNRGNEAGKYIVICLFDVIFDSL